MTITDNSGQDLNEEPSTMDRPTRRGRLGSLAAPSMTVLGVAVAAVVVAALIVSLVAWSNDHSKLSRYQGLDGLRASAGRTASSYAVAFGSYNYANLHGPKAPWTVIEDHSTAKFRSDYQRTSAALEPTIVSYKATAVATVPLAAVSSISSSKAVVLLQLSQTITNSTQKNGPQSQQFIVVMTMLRQKGQWLIDNVAASV